MNIVSVDTDLDDLSVTLIAEFDAPVEEVWALWSDPRKLEGWWGPPGYPATFEMHDLVAGGEATYFMTGSEGGEARGIWRVGVVDPPTLLEFEDVFADSQGTPIAEMPITRVRIRLIARGAGTRMEMRSRFASREDLEKWLKTGTFEAQRQAILQMDVLLRP